jgi:hypothetical protein
MRRQLDIRRLARVLVTVAGGVLLASGAATTASAAGTANPTMSHASQSQYCTDFVNHLSRNLNVSTDRLRTAVARSTRTTIDDAVAKGDLTRAQGDSLKKRFANQSVCPAASAASARTARQTS